MFNASSFYIITNPHPSTEQPLKLCCSQYSEPLTFISAFLITQSNSGWKKPGQYSHRFARTMQSLK